MAARGALFPCPGCGVDGAVADDGHAICRQCEGHPATHIGTLQRQLAAAEQRERDLVSSRNYWQDRTHEAAEALENAKTFHAIKEQKLIAAGDALAKRAWDELADPEDVRELGAWDRAAHGRGSE